MKYKISLEDRLELGYLFNAKGVPSKIFEWLTFWNFFNSKQYSAFPYDYKQVYIQEANTKTGYLVQETVTGKVVYGPLSDSLGVPAPSPYKELYEVAQDFIAKDSNNMKCFGGSDEV